jgi:4-oxalocrotonate tautomerase
MPILTVKISAIKTTALIKEINNLLLETTTTILKKKRALTAITLEFIPQDCWSIGGMLLSETHKNSFTMEIKITDETNTKEEKAHYIKAVYAGFEALLGSLHEESYIYVQDVRATAYGYGGKTQEYRGFFNH